MANTNVQNNVKIAQDVHPLKIKAKAKALDSN